MRERKVRKSMGIGRKDKERIKFKEDKEKEEKHVAMKK